MTIDRILFSSTQPSRTDIAWAKPVKGGFALYLYYNGIWQPMKVMDNAGSITTDDDVISDVSNISEIVEQEVERQMEGYDEKVNDTHNAPSNNDEEYPDIDIL